MGLCVVCMQVRQRLRAAGIDAASMTVGTFHAWGYSIVRLHYQVGGQVAKGHACVHASSGTAGVRDVMHVCVACSRARTCSMFGMYACITCTSTPPSKPLLCSRAPMCIYACACACAWIASR